MFMKQESDIKTQIKKIGTALIDEHKRDLTEIHHYEDQEALDKHADTLLAGQDNNTDSN